MMDFLGNFFLKNVKKLHFTLDDCVEKERRKMVQHTSLGARLSPEALKNPLHSILLLIWPIVEILVDSPLGLRKSVSRVIMTL